MTQDASTPAYQSPIVASQPTSQGGPPSYGIPFVEAIPDRTAARGIISAAAAGILAQLLFVHQAPGVNFLFWAAVVLGAAFGLRRPDARLDRYDLWLLPAALVFASFIMLRDDKMLLAFDVLATASLTVASAVAIGGQPVSRRASSRIVTLGAASIAVFCGGAARIANGLRPLVAALPSTGNETSASVLRGLLLAVPLVLGFVLLFAAADAVFQSMFQRLFDFRLDTPELIGRMMFGVAAAWFFAGTMAAAWLSHSRFPVASASNAAEGRSTSTIGTIETLIVLVAVDAIVAVFVIVQAAYLFPQGDPLGVSGMTYAEYARRGFFELVLAAVLSGLVILGLDTFVERKTWAYRAASFVLAALTGLVLVSAAVRLMLYQQAYGWTELRFYVLAAIVLLAAGVIASIALLLRDRVSLLPKFIVGAGLSVAIACNVVGPQAFVTAQNLERVINPALVPESGYSGLDAWYLVSLDADSIPIVIAHLDRLPGEDGALLRSALKARGQELRDELAELGWPSWNYSRQRAVDALTSAGY